MPVPTTVNEYLELLRSSQLVPANELESYLRRRTSRWKDLTQAGEVAQALLADGMLSRFQTQQLLKGRHRGFWIGKYLVLEILGAGGMSKVYLCEQTPMHRLVAVKILPNPKEPGALQRFYREARAVAALDHPNIVRAIDIDSEERFHFLIMEYVDGINLQDLVANKGRLEVARACHYIAQAALGLQHAHEAGWLHRDVKPSNLLVDRAGVVKILDLGLARFASDTKDQLTQRLAEEAIIGTADYLAPEQSLPGQVVDARADLYSLGGTLYFLLTGKTPFAEGSLMQKIMAHQLSTPQPVSDLRPKVPRELAGLVERMLAKSPTRRPQTAREVAAALHQFASAEAYPPAADELVEQCPRVRRLLQAGPAQPTALPPPTPEREPPKPPPLRPRRSPNVLAVVGVLALVLLLAVGGIVKWLSSSPPRPQPANSSRAKTTTPKELTDIVPGVLSPQEAARHVNQRCLVQMVVRSAGLNKNQTMLFLNSEMSYTDEKNFSVVVQGLDRDSGPTLDELTARYKDKTVRVTGRVTLYNGQPQIVVTELQQIQVRREPPPGTK